MENAKTIQIFLPNGDPRSIRVAEITTRIVRVIEIPRNALELFYAMPEKDQVALYFLVGDGPEGDTKEIYIGQTGGIGDRLKQHKEKRILDAGTSCCVVDEQYDADTRAIPGRAFYTRSQNCRSLHHQKWDGR